MENGTEKKTGRVVALVVIAAIVIAAVAYAVWHKGASDAGKETEAVTETEIERETETETESETKTETETETETETGTESETETEAETEQAAEKETKAPAAVKKPETEKPKQTEKQQETEAAEANAGAVQEEVLIEPETGSQNEGMKEAKGTVLDDSNLTIDSVGSYAGNFLEDGSDEPTANVAAIQITNHSSQMLQIAEITFQISDTQKANFKVTDLPAGATATVLESNKREYREGDDYSYGETATAYIDTPSLQKDKFTITMEKGKMILKNKTNKKYSKVYVYYKYTQLGGGYMGGITYRTPFDNVPANGEMEAVANHLNPDSSQIMDVQIVE